MNIKKYRTVIFLSILFCTSCAGPATPKGYQSEFQTQISTSGLKHFELRYTRHQVNRIRSDRANTGTLQSPKRQKRAMQKHAEKLITENDFCQDGFWTLNFELDLAGPALRGECNDLATQEDRLRFPGTIQNW